MVSAVFILVAGLGGAFALGLIREDRPRVAWLVTLAVLALMTALSFGWALALAGGGTSEIFTAGAKPPFAINLRVGLSEAVVLSVIAATGLLSALAMRDVLLARGRRAMAVLLVLVMALAGLVMTRDVFNLFVFFELAVLASAGLVLLSEDTNAVAAGFKYLVVAQVISFLLRVGIVFTYHATGSLNIDDIAAQPMAFHGASLALLLVLIALIVELKPFPANGWALDIYESAHPGFAALFSAASGSAALRGHPLMILAFASFVAMLVGLPPFPGFYAKWQLAHTLVAADRLPVLAAVLIGALIEAGVMFRWFGFAMKREADAPLRPGATTKTVVLAALALGWAMGAVWGAISGQMNLLATLPLLFALLFVPLDILPARVKNVLAIAGLVAWFAPRVGSYDPLRTIFAIIMLLGGAVIFLASFVETGRRMGFYPPAMLMYAGLALLIEADTSFAFFAA